MPALITDNIAIERGGVHYKAPLSDIAALTPINDTLTSTSTTEALSAAQGKNLKDLIDGIGDITNHADIAARDAAGPFGAGDVAFVTDDGDGKWARYQATAGGATGAAATWVKISDQDALAAGLGATNLGYTATATDGTVTNTSGSDSTIPAATASLAGLMVPAQFTKLEFVSATQNVDLDTIGTDSTASKAVTDLITVTGATDLDALRTASHDAVTTAGTALTNPIVVTGQEISFNIAGLAPAP